MSEYRILKDCVYTGYINNVYAGGIIGIEKDDTIDIEYSTLEQQFKGKSSPRAFRELIKGISKDYKKIRSRINANDNIAIRIALTEGFKIIGIITYKNNTVVELLKEN